VIERGEAGSGCATCEWKGRYKGVRENEVTGDLHLYSRGFIAGGNQLPYIPIKKKSVVFIQV
jgi:hypothetical protein